MPLDSFLAGLISEDYPAAYAADPDAVEQDLMYDCMTAEGFRYVRIDRDAEAAGFGPGDVAVDGEEYASAHGYGITRRVGSQGIISSTYVNPNRAITDGLSESEREAWGEQYNECNRLAFEEVRDPLQLPWNALHAHFGDELEDMDDRFWADPRITAATAEWSACMAQEGYSFAHEREPIGYLHGLAGPLEERVLAAGGLDHIDADLQAELDALLAQEVDIALADTVCSGPLDEAHSEVRADHQRRFLEEHQDRLALLRAELGG